MNTFRVVQRLSAIALNPKKPRQGALSLLIPIAFGLQLACSGRSTPGEGTPKSSQERQPGVLLEQHSNRVDISVNGMPFTSYHFKGYNKPIFFPLRSASGRIVTRGYPMVEDVPGESRDHPHHTGVWFTHGDVNGVDFWSETPESGTIKHRKLERVESGSEVGVLKSSSDWFSPNGELLLTEVLEVRIYNRTEARVMDLAMQLTASGRSVTFGDTKEGTFGMRLAEPFTEKEGLVIQNSQGARGEVGCWGKPARWVDYTTQLGPETLGVAILEHPRSFRHPTHWHARGYSLFAANPFGLHDFYNDKSKDGSHVLAKGESVQFRYRVYIHPGDATQARVEEEYRAFSNDDQP